MENKADSNKKNIQSSLTNKKKFFNYKIPNMFNGLRLWLMVTFLYVFLLLGIGYIAFWEQNFNNPEKFLVKYELLREKHFEVLKKTYGKLENIKGDEAFNGMVNEYMKTANNSAGDLQELASQSFNIVLGAFLAFLSATASILFLGNKNTETLKKES